MKKSIKIQEVAQVLAKNISNKSEVQAVINELESMLEHDDGNTTPKINYRLVGLYPNTKEYLNLPYEERPIIVAKIEEDFDHNSLPECLVKAAIKHNDSKRANKQGKVFTITDLLLKSTKKNLSEENLKIQYDGMLTLVGFDPQLVKEN